MPGLVLRTRNSHKQKSHGLVEAGSRRDSGDSIDTIIMNITSYKCYGVLERGSNVRAIRAGLILKIACKQRLKKHEEWISEGECSRERKWLGQRSWGGKEHRSYQVLGGYRFFTTKAKVHLNAKRLDPIFQKILLYNCLQFFYLKTVYSFDHQIICHFPFNNGKAQPRT